jgi:HEAT repeat protein
LKDENDELRWKAAWALGKIRNSDAVEPLITALDDKVPDVSWMASVALGQIGDSRAIERLISLLDNRDLGLRYSAEFSLKKITGKNFGQNSSQWKNWFRQEQLTAN